MHLRERGTGRGVSSILHSGRLFFSLSGLGKPQKKYVARPLRDGGGCKGQATKKKPFFAALLSQRSFSAKIVNAYA